MRAETNERIDLLMRVTGTSNAQLARALSFDASYISRIRTGKRGLPRERSFIEPAAAFFARNVRNSLQAATLAREMGMPQGWPDDEREVERLIAAWLVGERCPETPGDLDSSVTSESDEAEHEGEEGRSSTVRLFFGGEGRRQAALTFLDEIARRGRPTELLLQSDEDIAWMHADASFVDVWTHLMAGLAQAGCTFTVVHTVSRDGGEMWEGVREWLPLYLGGATRPYYYPRLRDGVRKRSLFVARGTCAVVANSVTGMEGDVLSMMLTDGDARLLEALPDEVDCVLGDPGRGEDHGLHGIVRLQGLEVVLEMAVDAIGIERPTDEEHVDGGTDGGVCRIDGDGTGAGGCGYDIGEGLGVTGTGIISDCIGHVAPPCLTC